MKENNGEKVYSEDEMVNPKNSFRRIVEVIFGSIVLILLFGLTYSFAISHYAIIPSDPIMNHVRYNKLGYLRSTIFQPNEILLEDEPRGLKLSVKERKEIHSKENQWFEGIDWKI